MNNYSEFQSWLEKLELVNSTQSKKTTSFNKYLNNKYHKIFKTHFPKKKKYSFDSIKELDETKELAVKIKSLANKYWDFWNKKRDIIKNKLYDLAENLNPPKTDSFIYWKTISSSSYSSQGFGCNSYAKNNANNYLDRAKFNGLEGEIRERFFCNDNKWGIEYNDYEIWVKTNELGLEILNYGKDLALKEQVCQILKRGGNPWVLFPLLPQSYMENMKINWQGECYA